MSHQDPSHDIQSALSLAEFCARAVSQALLDGDPAAVEAASRDLHRSSLSLAGALQPRQGKLTQAPEVRERLATVVQNMAMHREALLRRSAMVERSLHSIVPATRKSTYGGAAPYGHNPKQSGAFRLLSA